MQCVHISTDLPFYMPQLVVGLLPSGLTFPSACLPSPGPHRRQTSSRTAWTPSVSATWQTCKKGSRDMLGSLSIISMTRTSVLWGHGDCVRQPPQGWVMLVHSRYMYPTCHFRRTEGRRRVPSLSTASCRTDRGDGQPGSCRSRQGRPPSRAVSGGT